MEYELDHTPRACVLRFKSDLNAAANEDLQRIFVRMRQAEDHNVAVDMRQVGFLDSTVLGTLVWSMRNMREVGGDVRLFGLRDFVRNVFEMTGLDSAFQVFGSESDALESFASPTDPTPD